MDTYFKAMKDEVVDLYSSGAKTLNKTLSEG